MNAKFTWFNTTSLALGLAFLYLPMLVLIVYSFNDSRLVTVWSHFSTRWYGVLFADRDFLEAAIVSLYVGLASATIATALGTAAAYVLSRMGPFMGRTLFSALLVAPIVMPDVIIGLSMLLLFIAIGLERGAITLILAQVTFLMSIVAVVVSARLASFDKSLEEAAADLGCTPFAAFWLVTFPLIFPAVMSGWLLAFSISLDNVVIASFTTGPASTTLPLKIYSAVRLGVTPEINALSAIMIVTVTVCVVGASLMSKRKILRKSREEAAARAAP